MSCELRMATHALLMPYSDPSRNVVTAPDAAFCEGQVGSIFFYGIVKSEARNDPSLRTAEDAL